MSPGNPTVTLRFYEELGFFLEPERRKGDFATPFHPGDSVKFLIESLGVPHTEVDLILADGRSVGCDHPLRDGERISVYPVFESLDIGPLSRVRPRPLRIPRFVLDVHLGALAKGLRMLGFDSLYSNSLDDRSLPGTGHPPCRTAEGGDAALRPGPARPAVQPVPAVQRTPRGRAQGRGAGQASGGRGPAPPEVPPLPLQRTGLLAGNPLGEHALETGTGPQSLMLYFFLKRSIRPAVSTSFCLPVKNGWQAEQISTLMSLTVERVSITLPHTQVMVVGSYFA